MLANQTGPDRRVKALPEWRGSFILALPVLIGLGGCAGGWVNPNRTAAEMRADEAACDKDSEEDALARSGRQRADYGAPPGGPTAGSLGPSPMDMHDRDTTARDFDSTYDRCMEGKGYTRGKSKS